MRVVLAPDKFKGSLSAVEVAAAIARGLRKSYPDVEIVEKPIADGGEGTMALISEALGGEVREVRAIGPQGTPVIAEYSLAGTTAIMEMSSASGLSLVPKGARTPWESTSLGTGEMIEDALKWGTTEVIIGIGGSATNDGGRGMAEGLGYKFLSDKAGTLTKIEFPRAHSTKGIKFTVACDVLNPLLGPEGCTRVFGGQKGIVEADFGKHEERLQRLVEITNRDIAKVSADTPGAGAAGGMGFGLMAFCDAELRSGFELVAQLTGLEAAIGSADLVITGEGSLDAQTWMGKGPGCVAEMAKKAGKRVIALCGVAEDGSGELGGFDEVISLVGVAESKSDSMTNAAVLLEAVAANLRI